MFYAVIVKLLMIQ